MSIIIGEVDICRWITPITDIGWSIGMPLRGEETERLAVLETEVAKT